MRRFPSLLRHARSNAWLALVGFLGSPAAAAEPCQVHVTGPEQARWQFPASELQGELRAQRLVSACTRIVLDAVQGRVRLTFTQDDGRIAERWLEDPVELLPIVQALSVAVPDANTDADADADADGEGDAKNKVAPKGNPASAPTSSPARMSDSNASTEASTAPNPYALSPLFGAQVGFRAGAERLVTPTAGVEELRRFKRAFDRLSSKKREVFTLVVLEGLEGEEVARVLGIPVNTVWTRLHHARRELRATFEESRS